MIKEELALEKIVKKMINNGTGDDLAVAVLKTSLDLVIEGLVSFTQKFPLDEYQKQDFLQDIKICRSFIEILIYYTGDWYGGITSYLNTCEDLIKESTVEIGDDLPKGETEVSLELEEALFCAKLGVEVVLYCNIYQVPVTEVKELIRLRGEYLKQGPEDNE